MRGEERSLEDFRGEKNTLARLNILSIGERAREGTHEVETETLNDSREIEEEANHGTGEKIIFQRDSLATIQRRRAKVA